MGVLNLDFSQASGDVVPPGNYNVLIEKVEVRPPSQQNPGGAPNLNWTLRITEGSYANRRLFLNTNLAPQSLWKLQQILEGLGKYEEGLQLQFDDGSNFVTYPQLTGEVAEASVQEREWGGKKRADVVSLKGLNGASANGGQQFR